MKLPVRVAVSGAMRRIRFNELCIGWFLHTADLKNSAFHGVREREKTVVRERAATCPILGKAISDKI